MIYIWELEFLMLKNLRVDQLKNLLNTLNNIFQNIQWEDIDFENNLINVNHTLVYYSKGKVLSNKYAINTPKTRSGKRKIPMMKKSKGCFDYGKTDAGNIRNQVLRFHYGLSDFVFLNRFGKVHNNGTLNKALRRIVRDCNLTLIDKNKSTNLVLIPHLSNHIFMHTFTTRLNEQNINTKAMKSFLGHSDISTTMDIYVDVTQDFNIEQMKVFENAINLNNY